MVNTRVVMRLTILLLGLCADLAQAAEFTASVDHTTVALHEPVVLTLSLTNSDTRLRAEGLSPNVDLSVLAKDFDAGMPEVSNRYNVYQGRGRSTSEIRVELFAHRAGTLTIPAFRLEDLQTKPIRLTVRALPANEMPEVFSRGGVSKHSVWQREQFVAWLDVYHRVRLKSASIGEYIDTEPTRIELLEHRELPQAEREETVQGTRYQVTRIAWAIYPKESGELKVVLPDAWIVTADGRKLRLPHQPELVRVQALPATVTDDIPIGAPQLSQTAPTPAPSINQLSTWTVTVRGGFSRYALPETLPLPPVPARIKLYADRAARSSEVKPDGVVTSVIYNLSALPEEGGRYALPVIRVPYFDTARSELAVAESAGPVLEVNGGVPASAAAAPSSHARETANKPNAAVAGPGSGDARLWQWGSFLFAALWFATLALWWRSARPRAAVTKTPVRKNATALQTQHPLQAELLTALGGRSLDLGLREWEATHGVDPEVRAAVRAVQSLLYGPRKAADEAAIAAQVTTAVARIRGAKPPSDASLRLDPWRPESFSRELPPA